MRESAIEPPPRGSYQTTSTFGLSYGSSRISAFPRFSHETRPLQKSHSKTQNMFPATPASFPDKSPFQASNTRQVPLQTRRVEPTRVMLFPSSQLSRSTAPIALQQKLEAPRLEALKQIEVDRTEIDEWKKRANRKDNILLMVFVGVLLVALVVFNGSYFMSNKNQSAEANASITPTFAPTLSPSIVPSIAPSRSPVISPTSTPTQFPTNDDDDDDDDDGDDDDRI